MTLAERRIQVESTPSEPKASKPMSLEHADLIRAALEGKQIQWHNPHSKEGWLTFLTTREAVHAIASFPERKFRVKPDNVVFYVPIRQPESGPPYGCGSVQHMRQMPPGIVAALRVELDPATLKVVSATNEEVK